MNLGGILINGRPVSTGGGGTTNASDLVTGILPAGRLNPFDLLSPNVYDHGTVTNGNSKTLVVTHSYQKVLATGSAFTLVASGTYTSPTTIGVTITQAVAGICTITVPATINPAINNATATTTIRAMGSTTGSVVFIRFNPSGGVFVSREQIGDLVAPPTLQVAEYTASHVATTADGNYDQIDMNVAGANDFTLPPNGSDPIPIGTAWQVYQKGAGLTTIVAGVGVTVQNRGAALKSAGQYAFIYVEKLATDTWAVGGDTTT